MGRQEIRLYGLSPVKALEDAIPSGMVKPDAQWEDFIFERTEDNSDDCTGDYWPPIKGLSSEENLRQPPKYLAWLTKHGK